MIPRRFSDIAPNGARAAFGCLWLCLCFPAVAAAQALAHEIDPVAIVVDPRQVIDEAVALVGTRANAEALVEGLRLGSEIVLLEPESGSLRFTAPGGPIGYANVSMALALARTSLSYQGIGEPTLQQMAITLVGGVLEAGDQMVPVAGVLRLRSTGSGWGEVAEALGFSLGEAVSVAGIDDADRRLALATRQVHRTVQIVDRSIVFRPDPRPATILQNGASSQ